MAGTSLYHDSDEAGITDINVTPFVDVVLVLLVVFMVTAKIIVARGIETSTPKGSGNEYQAELIVSVNQAGQITIDGAEYPDDASAIAKIRDRIKTMEKPRAIIAGHEQVAYSHVMRAMHLATQAGASVVLQNRPYPAP